MLGSAFAQQGNQGAAPPAQPQLIRTGVVDMVVLLRAHPKLNDDLKKFNTYRQGIATQLMNEEQKLQSDAKIVMEKYKPGSQEYNMAMEELEKKRVELITRQSKAQRELMMEDMKIKYNAFKSIREEIQNFAVSKGFAVVLDVRGIDPEQGELENAQEEVGQTVVWNAPNVNLTIYIVHALNQKFSQFPATANIVNNQVVFLKTNNDGASPGPAVPNRPAPGQQPVATPGNNPAQPR